MSGAAFGLAELLARARNRALALGMVTDLTGGEVLREIADEVVRCAENGLIHQALRLTLLDFDERIEAFLGDDLYLDQIPPWRVFEAACELAERIDYFLAQLEKGSAGGHLARDCRANLDLLLVLADWCEENGLTVPAREARHLHQLARTALT